MNTTPIIRHAFWLLFAGVLFASPALGAQPNQAKATPENPTMQSKQAAADAVNNFYVVLNEVFAGNAQPMKSAWSHADDITFMGPEGAYLKGWGEIGPMWDEVAAARLGGLVTPKDVRTVVGSDLALVTCIESGENVSDGKTETVRIRSSTVFRLEGSAWKVIHHQTDLLGFMSDAR
jgi:ketosteroid isomerase-like protein